MKLRNNKERDVRSKNSLGTRESPGRSGMENLPGNANVFPPKENSVREKEKEVALPLGLIP